MKTATLEKTHPERASKGYIAFGQAALYRLSEPLEYDDDKTCSFLFVSTSAPMGAWETYAFPATETGDVLSWTELAGSEKGEVTHERVLENVGYRLVSPHDQPRGDAQQKEGK